MMVVYILAKRSSLPYRKQRAGIGEILRGSWEAVLALIMPLIILGGILSGIFTATEAAAVAVFYAFVVGILIYRQIRGDQLRRIIINSGITTSIILFIIATANILAWVLASQRVPQHLSAFFLSLGTSPYFVLFMVNVFLFVVGMFMETGAAVILLAPILHPALVSLGLHPLHVGLVFVLNLSIGLITPPVGVCLFVACTIAKISLERLSRAILPFMAIEVAVLMIVSFLPPIVLFVPRLFGYA
jgi:C4-dicarboxylate transporter DctM subunit